MFYSKNIIQQCNVLDNFDSLTAMTVFSIGPPIPAATRSIETDTKILNVGPNRFTETYTYN